MKTKTTLLVLFVLWISHFSANAQIIECSPAFPKVTDSVTITFHADMGSKGLMDYTGDVYAHTGVLISSSSSPGDWKHAPTWPTNTAKYKLTKIADNTYQLKIKPSISEYYGVAQSETVTKLAFVFRNADGSKTGKGNGETDIFYDVFSVAGLKMVVLNPLSKINVGKINDSFEVKVITSEADSTVVFKDGTPVLTNKTERFTYTVTISKTGVSKIVVRAYKGVETLSDTLSFYCAESTKVKDLPAGIVNGVNLISESSVLLTLTAPGKDKVTVIGDFNNWIPDTTYQMFKTSDGNKFWVQIDNLEAGKEYAYQFVVDSLVVADPYCHKVLDPDNDKGITFAVYPNLKAYPLGKTTGIVSVLQTKPAEYNWKYNSNPMPESQKLVIYELLVRDFAAQHSYNAVIDSLNYLKTLGINAIELMPVMEFEGNSSWGYNPSYHMALDKYYGTPEALKKLIDTCHANGIAVILDVVLNHAFGQNPMVQMYWDANNSRPAANSPWFNPVAKHDFNVGYDFNHESAYTKQYVADVLRYWLTEYNIDGYRFDLSKGFTQKNTLGNTSAWGTKDDSRIAILKNISDTIRKYKQDAYIILEHFANNDEEQVLADYGFMLWANMNQQYRDAAMGWTESGKANFTGVSYLSRSMTKPALVAYMESHDEERIGYSNPTWGNTSNPLYATRKLPVACQRAELGAAFFFTIPGPKMVWQFGELNYDYKIEYNGRTGEKPIKWDYYYNPNRQRLYEAYAALIALKTKLNAFNSSNYTLNLAAKVKTIAIDDTVVKVRIIGNFDLYAQAGVLTFPSTGYWYNYMTGDSINVTSAETTFNLQAGEYLILTNIRLKNPNIIDAPKAMDVNIAGDIMVKKSATESTDQDLVAFYTYFDANKDVEGASKYQWYRSTASTGLNMVAIDGATSLNYNVTTDDFGYYLIFEVTPVAATGFIFEGLPQYATIGIRTAINSVDATKISIYPNPASDYINISSGSPIKSIDIYDINGRIVLKSVNIVDSESVNVSNLKSGLYFVNAYTSKGTIKAKFLKK
ncbi:MAG TPA: alpha-amylase family glycosyl hydrolase [Bacteroidales bacterium]|nr:alpha-amylase family glycosyl hydrolase [Bacteroidales bacterium]